MIERFYFDEKAASELNKGNIVIFNDNYRLVLEVNKSFITFVHFSDKSVGTATTTKACCFIEKAIIHKRFLIDELFFEEITENNFIKSFNNKKLLLEDTLNNIFLVKINDEIIGNVSSVHELQNLITPLITHDDYEKIFHSSIQ